MEELIANNKLLADFAKAIYKDIELYINESEENNNKEEIDGRI